MSDSLETISIPAPGGGIRVAWGLPSKVGPHPVIVLLQDVFGLTEHLRGIGRRLVQEGFAVAIPDLYSRDPLRRELSDDDVAFGFPIFRQTDREAVYAALPERRREVARQAVAWLDGRDTSRFLKDALATIAWVRGRPEVDSDHIGVLGFGVGGGLVGRLAVGRAPIAAGVVFYGQVPSESETKSIRIPLLGHYAQNDPTITPKVHGFSRELALRSVPFAWTVHLGTSHGFFNDTRLAFHAPAAKVAWIDTLAFLHRYLPRRGVGE